MPIDNRPSPLDTQHILPVHRLRQGTVKVSRLQGLLHEPEVEGVQMTLEVGTLFIEPGSPWENGYVEMKRSLIRYWKPGW